MNTLPIAYKSNREIGVVNNDPYAFLVLDELFEKVMYISDEKQKWLEYIDMNGEFKYISVAKTLRYDTSRFLRSKKVAEFLSGRPKLKLNMYEPVDPPYKINPLRLFMNSPAIAHAYENKRYFRDEFSDLIRMPEYVIRYLNELDRAASYRDLCEELDTTKMVIQDEQSSGSKGTFIVDSADSYIDAVKALKRHSSGGSIIVSKFVRGLNTSMQVCITRYGIFTNGVQKQLVDTPELCNVKLAGASKWCGGVIGAEPSEIVFHQAREIATVIGTELAAHGYKGIFSIDLITTEENEVYAIEINARHTGFSQLISDIQLSENKIPFMLLHTLELANEDYVVEDLDALPSYSSAFAVPFTYMIINNPHEEEYSLSKEINPGIYERKKNGISFVKNGWSVSDIENDNQVIVISRYQPGDPIGRGKRIVKIICRGNLMDDAGLSSDGKKLVRHVKKKFELNF